MDWHSVKEGKYPTAHQQVIVEINACCFLASYDPEARLFRMDGKEETIFDPQHQDIKWAELSRRGKRA